MRRTVSKESTNFECLTHRSCLAAVALRLRAANAMGKQVAAGNDCTVAEFLLRLAADCWLAVRRSTQL